MYIDNLRNKLLEQQSIYQAVKENGYTLKGGVFNPLP